MRLAVVGSREFPLWARYLVERAIAKIARKAPDTVIISGGAQGVDTWAADAGRAHGLEVIEEVVTDEEWDLHPKQAGLMRNTRVVAMSDAVLAFHDGVSRGTMDTVRKAREAGLKVQVIEVRR